MGGSSTPRYKPRLQHRDSNTYLHTNGHSSTNHNSQKKAEITQMSIMWWIDQQNMMPHIVYHSVLKGLSFWPMLQHGWSWKTCWEKEIRHRRSHGLHESTHVHIQNRWVHRDGKQINCSQGQGKRGWENGTWRPKGNAISFLGGGYYLELGRGDNCTTRDCTKRRWTYTGKQSILLCEPQLNK